MRHDALTQSSVNERVHGEVLQLRVSTTALCRYYALPARELPYSQGETDSPVIISGPGGRGTSHRLGNDENRRTHQNG